jgi:hypothetical protein
VCINCGHQTQIVLQLRLMHARAHTQMQAHLCAGVHTHTHTHIHTHKLTWTTYCSRYNLIAYEIAIPIGVTDEDMIARVTALGQSQYLDDKIQVCASTCHMLGYRSRACSLRCEILSIRWIKTPIHTLTLYTLIIRHHVAFRAPGPFLSLNTHMKNVAGSRAYFARV